ncbi:MAG: hypothetical protein ABIO36_05895 [Pyrinomonadaceae bacterium]
MGTNPSDKSARSIGKESKPTTDDLFDKWDSHPPAEEFTEAVRVDSLESAIGYSSLLRQMHRSFVRSVAFYRSPTGGSLSSEEARARAFHACTNVEEAKKEFDTLMGLPLESLNFVDFMELQAFAPRVAEQLWEMAKLEGQKEFLSGHLAANITFPVGYMKEVWNIARYLGVRESFIADWEPSGGIEMSLIDMMTQSYFQWQFWLEETVKRSQTREKEVHHEYARWMAQQDREANANGYDDGYWVRPTIAEAAALDQAVQMADRWNRIYMRTLRQLRDLRRFAPVTINNPSQVNIASDGGQQVNISGE